MGRRMAAWFKKLDAISKSGLTANERLVLIMLTKYENNTTGKCWPSGPTICKDTGLSRATVHRCFRSLRSKGVVTTKRRRNPKNGYFGSFEFALNWNAPVLTQSTRPSTHSEKMKVLGESTQDSPIKENGSGTWVDDICSDWFAAYGGRIRKQSTEKAMSQLVTDHGIATVRQRWQYYLRSHPDLEGRYANVHRFVATFGIWTEVKARSRRAAMRNGEPDL